jgi:hypothetical protein
MTKLIVAFRNFAKAPENATEVVNQVQACLCLSVCLSLSIPATTRWIRIGKIHAQDIHSGVIYATESVT